MLWIAGVGAALGRQGWSCVGEHSVNGCVDNE